MSELEEYTLMSVDDDDTCDGHESLAGAHMGESVFCDGQCVRPG